MKRRRRRCCWWRRSWAWRRCPPPAPRTSRRGTAPRSRPSATRGGPRRRPARSTARSTATGRPSQRKARPRCVRRRCTAGRWCSNGSARPTMRSARSSGSRRTSPTRRTCRRRPRPPRGVDRRRPQDELRRVVRALQVLARVPGADRRAGSGVGGIVRRSRSVEPRGGGAPHHRPGVGARARGAPRLVESEAAGTRRGPPPATRLPTRPRGICSRRMTGARCRAAGAHCSRHPRRLARACSRSSTRSTRRRARGAAPCGPVPGPRTAGREPCELDPNAHLIRAILAAEPAEPSFAGAARTWCRSLRAPSRHILAYYLPGGRPRPEPHRPRLAGSSEGVREWVTPASWTETCTIPTRGGSWSTHGRTPRGSRRAEGRCSRRSCLPWRTPRQTPTWDRPCWRTSAPRPTPTQDGPSQARALGARPQRVPPSTMRRLRPASSSRSWTRRGTRELARNAMETWARPASWRRRRLPSADRVGPERDLAAGERAGGEARGLHRDRRDARRLAERAGAAGAPTIDCPVHRGPPPATGGSTASRGETSGTSD